jgi:hypothetical protein
MTPEQQPRHARHLATVDPYDEPTAPSSWDAAYSQGQARARNPGRRSRSGTRPVTRGGRRRHDRAS